MIETTEADSLAYASQDEQAAFGLCESLGAAGLECPALRFVG
jgi:hypothetical protein